MLACSPAHDAPGHPRSGPHAPAMLSGNSLFAPPQAQHLPGAPRSADRGHAPQAPSTVRKADLRRQAYTSGARAPTLFAPPSPVSTRRCHPLRLREGFIDAIRAARGGEHRDLAPPNPDVCRRALRETAGERACQRAYVHFMFHERKESRLKGLISPRQWSPQEAGTTGRRSLDAPTAETEDGMERMTVATGWFFAASGAKHLAELARVAIWALNKRKTVARIGARTGAREREAAQRRCRVESAG